MRILIAGAVSLVIWCIVSAWLYNDKLLPALQRPALAQTIPGTQSNAADSLMKLKASMPETLKIYFDFDKSKFTSDPQTDNSIIPLKAWLDKYPAATLSVIGHTDLVGTEDYNYNLGLKRARVTGKYLENKGIDASRLIIGSKGETEPAADYLTPEGRAKNRRTEVSIKIQ